MKNAKLFWDKVAPKYAKDPIKDMAAYEYTLGRTKSYLTADDRVLEMGCGTGSTALLLAPHVREITGTDLSPAMVKIARKKASDQGVVNARFEASSAANTTTDAYDAVLGFNLYHLVENAEDVFAQIYKMLPVGGYFMSKTACLGDPSLGFKRAMFKALIPPMQWLGKAPYVRFFSHAELENAMIFAGFEIVESGNFPSMSRYIVARKR